MYPRIPLKSRLMCSTINQSGLALREYDMIDGHVGYWTTKEDILSTEHPVIIIDIKGAIEITKELGEENVRIAYVNGKNFGCGKKTQRRR